MVVNEAASAPVVSAIVCQKSHTDTHSHSHKHFTHQGGSRTDCVCGSSPACVPVYTGINI